MNSVTLPLLLQARRCMSHWEPTLHSGPHSIVEQTGLLSTRILYPWEHYSTRLSLTPQIPSFQFKFTPWVQGVLQGILLASSGTVRSLPFHTVVHKLTFTTDYLLTSTQRPVQDFSPITQSDIALFGVTNAIWINHTQPTVLAPSSDESPPTNTFPFSRLASIMSADLTYTYLYHQMNGTTLAEEQWDSNTQIWTTTYIPVSY